MIRFIDENLLLKATNGAEKDLTDAERKRNSFSPSFSYTYDPKAPLITYPSSMPVHFPPIEQVRDIVQPQESVLVFQHLWLDSVVTQPSSPQVPRSPSLWWTPF